MENINYIILAFIGVLFIFLIGFLLDYINKYKQSLLRESYKDKQISDNRLTYLNTYKQKEDSVKVYQILTELLLTQPLIYARGAMRKYYEVRANGLIFTRIKTGDNKRINVQGQLYYIWSNDTYISRTDLIEALGNKDSKKVVEYLNLNSKTLEDLKDLENKFDRRRRKTNGK